MFSFIYDLLLLLLGIFALPKLLWQCLKMGKYKRSFLERLGLKLPTLESTKEPVIWMHMVSVGETRAVIPLYKKIRKEYPNAKVVISSITETGQMEAKRSMPDADLHFFLPLDFSWIIRKTMRKIHPNILILVECEFWYHLIFQAKKNDAEVFLVNGRISERSSKRFSLFSFFTKELFKSFDALCLQTDLYKKRFVEMGIDPSKLFVTGNLKFDVTSKKLTPEEIESWRGEMGIAKEDRVVVIGSSHNTEEEILLSALDPVFKSIPNLKVILVPRHPERFNQVFTLVKEKGFSTIAYSKRAEKTGSEKVILIDAMGLLLSCYQLADIAIVGGSFIDHIGGHNVFEPVECGVPVIFGPFMKEQAELADIVLTGKAGVQVSANELADWTLKLLTDPIEYQARKEACSKLTQQMRGSIERTWQVLAPFFKKKIALS